MIEFGLIGRTLKHSFSQTYFSKKFAAESLQGYSYVNFELADIAEITSLFDQHPNLKGINITIPYKKVVLPFLTKADPVVAQIGACNCIKRQGNDLFGFNTDVVGFRNALLPLLKPHHKRALVLGTGGASKAVAYVLDSLQIPFLFVSRKAGDGLLAYEDVTRYLLQEHMLIINTTPTGTWPEILEKPLLPYHHLTANHFLFDLIYNPEKTSFLQEGESRGAQISNGYQMLVEQAEESWRIWNNATI